MFRIRNVDYLVSLFLAFLPTTLFALPTDNMQKVYIVADSTTYNYKNGINVFEGHVKIDQGTTHITADKLITKSNAQHKIEEAIAYGYQELAHYWTLPKEGEPEMHAKAKIIKYYPIQANITLQQEVYVTQGENSFQGNLIHYNSKDQTVTVPASTSGHAVLVYNPDK